MTEKSFDEVYWLNFSSYEDLRLYEVGRQECAPGYAFGPIIRDKYILHYVLRGEGALYLDNREFKVKEKQAFLLPSNMLTYYQADEEKPWEYVWIHFHGFKALELLRKAGLTKKNPVFVPTAPCDAIGECLLDILRHPREEYACMGNLYRLFQLLIDASANKPEETKAQDNTSQYVKMVTDYISQKYSEPIRIQEIADYCGLERSYLSKIFKYATGYTPQEYLIWHRINMAKQLLRESEMPIQHVSYSVGYNDPLAFSKVFKRETGVSPSRWRQGVAEDMIENDLNLK